MQLLPPSSPLRSGAARSTAALAVAGALLGLPATARDGVVQATGDSSAYWHGVDRQLVLPQGSLALDTLGVNAISQLVVDGGGQGWTAVATRQLLPAGPPEVIVLRGEGTSYSVEAPDPAPFPRSTPALLTRGGQLDRHPATLMWLEGATPRQHELRLSHWDGRRFAPAETLVMPGPGSQVGLQATELEDGRLLAVWSAFDGTDTDLLFVLGTRSAQGHRVSWSRPRRVGADNDVPDVTPHLLALPDGSAALAWSTFDATEYRSVVAHLPAGRDEFTRARPLGPRGQLQPRLHEVSDGRVVATLLDAQTAQRSGTMAWHTVGIRAASEGLRVTGRTAATPAASRPLVRSSDRNGVQLQHPTSRDIAGNREPSFESLSWRSNETDQEMPR